MSLGGRKGKDQVQVSQGLTGQLGGNIRHGVTGDLTVLWWSQRGHSSTVERVREKGSRGMEIASVINCCKEEKRFEKEHWQGMWSQEKVEF